MTGTERLLALLAALLLLTALSQTGCNRSIEASHRRGSYEKCVEALRAGTPGTLADCAPIWKMKEEM